MQDIMTHFRQLAGELDLEWMAGVIVNQKAHGGNQDK
jgi:hypothetical protein